MKGSFAANACTENYDINEFHIAFSKLLERDDVQAIWISLYSFDEDEYWPYSDTAFISTTLPESFLNEYFGEVFPSEITCIDEIDVSFGTINEDFKLYMLWWD